MTVLKLTLASATALALTGSFALAQSNEAYDVQNGSDNELLIEQTYTGNNNNDAGTSSLRLQQNGNFNSLTINQTADSGAALSNTIGTAASPEAETIDSVPGGSFSGGIEQRGNKNVATLTQGSDGTPTGDGGNAIQDVIQFTHPAYNLVGPPNTLTIDQQGRHNVAEDIVQTQYDNGINSQNSADIQQTGVGSVAAGASNRVFDVEQVATFGDNDLIIEQTSNGGGVLHNNIRSIAQHGTGGGTNFADLFQDGHSNRILSGRQFNSGGNDNNVTMSFTGNLNGRDAFTNSAKGAGSIGLTVVNGESGANGYYQSGTGNILGYTVGGASNSFTFQQIGNFNDINGVVSGDSNEAAITMGGDSNVVDFDQADVDNDIGVAITGSNNYLNMEQQGSTAGNGNLITVSIDGSDNNQTSDTYSGAAAAAATVALANLSGFTSSFDQGSLMQDGLNNEVDLTVTTSDNNFSTLQDGNSNVVVGQIGGANGNQAVVVQLHNNNTANFIQNGSNNNVGIIQNGS